MDDKEVNPIDKEREEKSKKFFREQEKKVTLHQNQMRRLQLREQQERLKMMEEKKLLRERNEIRREAEREQRHLAKLQQQHQVGASLCFFFKATVCVAVVVRKLLRSATECTAVRIRCS